ncbi:TonB-dependent receptor [Sphingomonas quercus]|uniref:TonB-dependent receptor n=1 Tax=Sphingomonas quercus TaxID=2842451 RepID=A0ABS6BHZ3_9SPHN|nr:TonB-dependent receptor [Sphingomonas quercus]MBU3076840.1 TonB-dependent receptor [Sphingomonas quercus]
MKSLKPALLVATALPALAAFPAFAQEAPTEQAIVITGSRLASPDLTGSAPVTVLGREAIEQTGSSSVGELLREMPVATSSASESSGRGNNGTATVALRGLSAVNTLVLINGRRVLPFSDAGTVDLNSIPFEAVERVEVLQDGASAIYGSDAIAGVVNLIMRKDFEGLIVKGGLGFSTYGDLPLYEASATYGKRFTRGGFLVNVSWRKSGGNVFADRPITRDPDWRPFGGHQQRDPLPPYPVVEGLPGTGDTQMILRDGITQATSVADFRPASFPSGTDPSIPNDGINYYKYESVASSINQINVLVNGDYELSSNVKAFVEGSFVRRKSLGFLAPDYFGAVFGQPITVSANNDYNPFGVDLDVSRTIIEQPLSGRRLSDVSAKTYRIVGGLEGTIGDSSWKWDVSYNYQKLDQFTNGGRGILYPRLQEAAGDSDLCRATPGCVPINLLGGPGTITQAMIDPLSADSWTDVNSSLQSATANISGTLFALPAGDVQIAVGGEYRTESYDATRDPISSTLDPATNSSPFLSRSYSPSTYPPTRKVSEAYAELAVPILKDVPFFNRLDLELAGRFSHYNQFGTTTNPKIGVKWRPVRDVLLRGSWGTGFRAPTFQEAYAPQSTGYSSIIDPCAQVDFASYAKCGPTMLDAQGKTGTFIITGGNPDLKPEKAKNLTLGTVITPSFIPRLSLTVDFYKIRKTNVITTADRNYVLRQNATDGSYADIIKRDPATGLVTSIYNVRQNLASLRLQGIDVGFQYATATAPIGRFTFRGDMTYLDSFKTSPAPDTPAVEYAGTYSSSNGTLAKVRATGRITWDRGPLSLTTALRYVGPVTNTASNLRERANSYVQNDWMVTYNIDVMKAKISFGIDNIFNKMPPMLVDVGYDFNTFNARGRFFALRVQKDF